jgi:cysteinyl-tRNA synthetase
MALRLLGPPPIDIHAGGVDLIFPHHENEIAQSEGATRQQFSRFWVHVEHLMIDTESDDESKAGAEKMSKSLGNVFNLQDIVAHGFRPSALRYLYLGVHYRKQLKFSWTAMAQAEESLKRLTDFLARLDTVPARDRNPAISSRLEEAETAFSTHLTHDVNAAAGIGVMFDLVRALNSAIDAAELGTGDVPAVRSAFDRFDRVLGVLTLRRAEDEQPPVPVDEIERLIEARRAARLSRNFAEADRIRKDLDARGIVLEDTGSTTRWKRK